MSAAEFSALGAEAVAKRAEVVAASGNAHFALHALRRELRARSHAGDSDHFRRRFVRDYVTGESIRGKRCLTPCTHIYGANASEHQVWVHTTSANSQEKSAHEKSAATAAATNPRPISFFFSSSSRASRRRSIWTRRRRQSCFQTAHYSPAKICATAPPIRAPRRTRAQTSRCCVKRAAACKPVLLSGVTTSRRTTRARTPVWP